MRHVVVAEGDRIVGTLRVNTLFRQASGLARPPGYLGRRSQFHARRRHCIRCHPTTLAKANDNGAHRPPSGQVPGALTTHFFFSYSLEQDDLGLIPKRPDDVRK